ncbi:hypothetical protein NDU88_006453 [Pleurodeles waltl]|uniref:Uncharacterized protein n=1 Tax=Pleurodeles waltl TaxID=8319 RepID=A0AAV7WEB3_PLEWA|nr:hypothetical protein NDU88_006453 [Pleurodeles waltl]
MDTKGVILTPAGAGRRPLSGNRHLAAPRSKDRWGHSDLPAVPAGANIVSARRHSGKAACNNGGAFVIRDGRQGRNEGQSVSFEIAILPNGK